jgi:hypothetical protein
VRLPARQRPLEQSMRPRTHADRQHPPFSTRKARAAPEIRRLPEPAIRHRAPKPFARCAVFGAVIACRRNSSVDQQPIVVQRGQRWSAKIAKAMSGGVSSVRNPVRYTRRHSVLGLRLSVAPRSKKRPPVSPGSLLAPHLPLPSQKRSVTSQNSARLAPAFARHRASAWLSADCWEPPTPQPAPGVPLSGSIAEATHLL